MRGTHSFRFNKKRACKTRGKPGKRHKNEQFPRHRVGNVHGYLGRAPCLVTLKTGFPGQTREGKRGHDPRNGGKQRYGNIGRSDIEMRDDQRDETGKDAAHGSKEQAARIAELGVDLSPK